MKSRSPIRSRSPKRSRSRSPSRSSRGPPSYNSRIQDRPQRFYQPRFGEREFREGREQNYHRGGHRGGQSRGHNPYIICHTCGEKGHISSQCSNQNSQQDRRRVQQFGRGSPAQRFGGFGGSAGPAQSPRRSLDNSRTSRDTDFGKSERLSRLAESPNMQGDTCGKSAEEIEMEKIMGFSGFHQSREKYFEEQSSTLGSAKAGFSPKYDKFFPKKSEFDSPPRKESKETKSRESSSKKSSHTKSESQKRSIFDSPTRGESPETTSRETSKKTSNTESESKRSKLESTKPPMEPPAPKKPKPSSTQMAPILETESDIQNKKSKSTKPPILEQPTSDLVVALIIDELIKQIFDKRAESENQVGLIIEDLVKQICDKAAESEKWNYESMHGHFTSRIQKICKLSSDESLIVANAMIKACKEAFPCLNSDLRAHYLSAKMELEGLKENNNNNILPNFSDDERSKVMVSGAKSSQELWLLDFRQSIHSQLSEKVQEKQANLYSFSEIVDLILSYFSV